MDNIWCIIPVYNNAGTVGTVARECRSHLPNVLVVDDGSTDADLQEIFADSDINVLRHRENRGKGAALKSGFNFAARHGARFAITIDGDGQHFPEDLLRFIPELREDTIIIGAREKVVGRMPGKSRFGRRFSDFWVRLETGRPVRDTQSGFRAYPVRHIKKLPLKCRRYDFEIEVLARAAWAGLKLKSIPVKVRYHGPEERVSGFRPLADNLRISLTHSRLIGRRMIPWPFKRLVPREFSPTELFRHPTRVLRRLLGENASPRGLAAAAWTGVFLGALPLISLHMITVLFVTMRLRLNRIMALSIQNICMPPLVPGICIAFGYYMRNGHVITQASIRQLGKEPLQRFFDWCVGSLVVAPALASICALIIFCTAKILERKQPRPDNPESEMRN